MTKDTTAAAVAAADGTVNPHQSSPPAVSSSVEIMESKEKLEDALLILKTLKDTPVSKSAAADNRRSTNPTAAEAETELDLAACLISLSRTSPTTVTQSISTPPKETAVSFSSSKTQSTDSSKRKRETKEDPKPQESSPKIPKLADGDAMAEKPQPQEQGESNWSWETGFQELKTFQTKFGHAKNTVFHSLARWLDHQRELFRNGSLAPERAEALRFWGCVGFEEKISPVSSSTTTTTEAKKKTSTSKNSTPPVAIAAQISKNPQKTPPKRLPRPHYDPTRRILKEAFPNAKPGKPTIEEFTDNDVVCGRGASIYKLHGNVQFRSFCAIRKLEYIACEEKEKMPIAADVVRHIRSMGGRFLMKHGPTGLWYDAGDKIALKKTAMTLRQDARAIREKDGRSCKSVENKKLYIEPVTEPAKIKRMFKNEKVPYEKVAVVEKPQRPQSLTKSIVPGEKPKPKQQQSLNGSIAEKPKHQQTKSIVKKPKPQQQQSLTKSIVTVEKPKPNQQLSLNGSIANKPKHQPKKQQTKSIVKKRKPQQQQSLTKSIMNWNSRFAQLAKFKVQNGHANPMQGSLELVEWLLSQREKLCRGTLQEERRKMLHDIGCDGFSLVGTKIYATSKTAKEEEASEVVVPSETLSKEQTKMLHDVGYTGFERESQDSEPLVVQEEREQITSAVGPTCKTGACMPVEMSEGTGKRAPKAVSRSNKRPSRSKRFGTTSGDYRLLASGHKTF